MNGVQNPVFKYHADNIIDANEAFLTLYNIQLPISLTVIFPKYESARNGNMQTLTDKDDDFVILVPQSFIDDEDGLYYLLSDYCPQMDFHHKRMYNDMTRVLHDVRKINKVCGEEKYNGPMRTVLRSMNCKINTLFHDFNTMRIMSNVNELCENNCTCGNVDTDFFLSVSADCNRLFQLYRCDGITGQANINCDVFDCSITNIFMFKTALMNMFHMVFYTLRTNTHNHLFTFNVNRDDGGKTLIISLNYQNGEKIHAIAPLCENMDYNCTMMICKYFDWEYKVRQLPHVCEQILCVRIYV